jgi:hypothetical protein
MKKHRLFFDDGEDAASAENAIPWLVLDQEVESGFATGGFRSTEYRFWTENKLSKSDKKLIREVTGYNSALFDVED